MLCILDLFHTSHETEVLSLESALVKWQRN